MRKTYPETRRAGWVKPAALVGLVLSLTACSSPESKELAAAQEALGAGRYAEAIEHYTEVTLQAPDSPEAAQALYEVALIQYLRRRDLDAARTTFREVMTSYPESDVARDAQRLLARMYEQDLGEPDKAIDEYESLLQSETDPVEKNNLLLRVANCLYTMDDLEGAALAYRQVVEAAPRNEDSVAAYLRLAHIERLTGRPDESVANFAAVLKVSENPSFRRRAYQGQAEILVEQGHLEEAKACLAAASKEFAGDEEMAALAARIEDLETERRRAENDVTPDYEVHWGRGRP